MSVPILPPIHSLEQLKKQAKALLTAAFAAWEPGAGPSIRALGG